MYVLVSERRCEMHVNRISFLSMGFIILDSLDIENIYFNVLNDFKILQYCRNLQ